MAIDSFHILRNPPIQVFFDGFISNTYELYRNGWTITMDQDIARFKIIAVFTHQRSKAILITERVSCQFERSIEDPFYVRQLKFVANIYRGDSPIPPSIDYSRLVEVESEPSMEIFNPGKLSDYVIFKEKPKKEIFVEPATVPEMLEMIKKMQSPKQKEIREKRSNAVKRDIYQMQNEMNFERHLEIVSVK